MPAAPKNNRPLIDENLKTPLYMQVYSTLYQWIRQGRFQPGAKLDSEARMCDQFGVSRISVRKALDLLASEGWVVSRQGKGTFVSDKKPAVPAAASMEARISRSHEFAKASKTRDLKIEEIPADRQLASDLRLSVGDLVQFISYTRMLDGRPVGYIEAYFPASLGVVFTPKDFERSTSITVLADKGFTISGMDNLFGATLANTEMASVLNVHVGSPLVRTKMTVLDEVGKPLAWLRSRWPADEYEHHVYMARNAETGAPALMSPQQSAVKK